MKNYTVYPYPYPPMTEWLSLQDSMCRADVYDDDHGSTWRCTREARHPGRHEAGGSGGVMYVSWED